ncbi:unnamed protein product [Parascedosporium putredinis]|uniref:Glycoside hydrolase family 5 domain-containing protein n=1 Tax=Parascedosporium putredinis TaxID=1442378 RepID=A0A9P1GW81_9PEZI|nr:unnamed protein product [Parascedosporium putredinis]CAI7989278.1 unnamed protein product [Parascedosporium putredinis]
MPQPVFDDFSVASRQEPLTFDPLTSISSGRWILDAHGARVKLRCINWAGHMEANIPEGLHKQPIPYLADWIASAGFNCVRLTYSTDMALAPNLRVRDSFRAAAAETKVPENAMLALYDAAVAANPFSPPPPSPTKASWCCNLDDGNGWWSDAPIYLAANSRYFDSAKWMDGLKAMAAWSRNRPGVVGMSLRNELRATWTQILFASGTWYSKMTAAARLVHETNPDLLVTHDYSFTVTTPETGNCDITKTNYGLFFGFVLEQGKSYTGPLWLSEFGVNMQGGPNSGLSDADFTYLTCLVSYMESNDADWSLWAIQGSYYVRDGVLDQEETWGALDRDWKDWRNKNFKGLLGKMWTMTQRP